MALEACGRNCNVLPVPYAKTGFFGRFLGGPKRVPKKVSKKGLKMDPQWTPNGSQNTSKWTQKGGSENDRKLAPPFGRQKVIFCGYLQYFRGVGPLRKGSLLGILFGAILGTKVAQKES